MKWLDWFFILALIDVIWQLYSQIFEDAYYHSIIDQGKLLLRLILMVILAITIYRRVVHKSNNNK